MSSQPKLRVIHVLVINLNPTSIVEGPNTIQLMPTIIGPRFLFAPPDAGGVPLLAIPISSTHYATFQERVRDGMSIPSSYDEVWQRPFPGHGVEKAIVGFVEVR